MASSYTLTSSSYEGRQLRLYCTQTQNVANNTSTINWTLYSEGGSAKYYTVGPTTVTINGTQVYYKARASYSTQSFPASTGSVSGSTTVSHNNDGSKSISVSLTTAIYTSSTSTSSGTWTLDSIPRASSISSISGNTIGSSITINISRNVSSFTHQVWYRLNSSGDWVNLGTGYGTSCTFTPPMSLCNSIPNSTSGILNLCVRTLSGSTMIGSDVYKDITVYVPSSVVPSVSSVSVTEATSGLASKFGFYIQNKSTLKVSISASGSYSSSIRSYSTTFNGVTYSGSSFTTGTINNSGSLNMVTTVTDSRGRTASRTTSVSLTAYSNPSVSAFSVYRANSSGTAGNAGTYLKMDFAFGITSLSSKNSKTYTIEYKAQSASAWTTLTTVTPTDYSASSSYLSSSGILDMATTYDVRFTVSDYFTGSSISRTISTTATAFNVRADETGVAVGKMSELGDTFDVAWNTRLRQGLTVDGSATVGGALMIPQSIQEGSTVPTAGTLDNCTSIFTYLQDKPSFMGTLTQKDVWFNVISSRHRNGGGDGTSYGMMLWSKLSIDTDHLKWAQQMNGNWKEERILLDSKNLGSYFADRVTSQGTSGIWRYRQWASGVKECWGTWTGTINLSTHNYSGFYYTDTQTVNFPFTFSSTPSLQVNGGPTNFIAGCKTHGVSTTQAGFLCYGHSTYSQSGVSVYLYAIGV